MLAMKTLPQHLLARGEAEPARVAQRHKHRGIWREYTFGDVLANVRDFALGLYELGLRPGETVAVIGENEPEHFWTEYAAQAVGAKVVSLYPDLTADEAHYLVDDSEAVYLVAQDQEQVDKALAVMERAPALRAIVYWDDTGMWSYRQPALRKFIEVQALGRARHEREPALFGALVAAGAPDDIAVLSYTSGTTGKPKGVILTHRYLIDNAQRLAAGSRARPGLEYLSYIAPAWATEQLFGLSMGLLVPFVVNFPEGPEQVLDNIRELAVGAMVFAPRQWESLAATIQARMLDAGRWRRRIFDWGVEVGRQVHVARLDGKPVPAAAQMMLPLAEALVLRPLRDQLGLTRIEVAVCGGSTMAPDVFRLFHAIGVPLRNVYGSTEIGILTMHQGERYDLETVGHWLVAHPEAGLALEWKVSDSDELLVRGGSFFGGYWRREDKTAERISDGWYLTGDAVSVTESGELVFLERVDDLRRLRSGERFPPQFIETRLRFSPFIKDIMILGDERRDYIAALINIDFSVVSRWAEDRNIGFSTFADLSQKEDVAQLIRAEIERVNQFLPEHSRVRRFANFPKELDPDEGELTRTRKLRREFLEERYAALVDGLYDGRSEVHLEIPVTYQDGRKGTLAATVRLHDAGGAGQPPQRG
ncbi:AMP-dependent synthetase/ligase [Quisquiliibacterium transsilvanicum]|uniref:Long-chain acyl-CoA synthetase n=1 Tax=Quisquiliibacterium transsilvanicum TaxID=1549638 RepID=A0A7W8M8S3_9BURK|nr:AMP-binding protein [Quisquiliibacterium transsilvanicum]MBB5271585.1 long-chain acyl-CoA synthetase [Quisquiliibacterium transsilvanicum]